MKQRAKIKWDKDLQAWHVTYSDGISEYSVCDTLGEALDDVTDWELEQVKAQQEVSG